MFKIAIAFLIGLCPIIVLVIGLRYDAKNKRKRKNKPPRKIEFKKILVTSVLITYFLGVIFACYIIYAYDYSQLSALLAYLGTPTTGAIFSYCYVIRTENAIKLKRMYPEETEGYTVDINNTNV